VYGGVLFVFGLGLAAKASSATRLVRPRRERESPDKDKPKLCGIFSFARDAGAVGGVPANHDAEAFANAPEVLFGDDVARAVRDEIAPAGAEAVRIATWASSASTASRSSSGRHQSIDSSG
jgi:hypothetical protein